ncbi:MAG: pyridoxamine 5'-phosphate oxidase [Chlorobi bacterium]|nr:pyridoxamine 5'-phosphate oxidase [Chlorobiota bacterium]
MGLSGLRQEYQKHRLSKKNMSHDPFVQFKKWFDEAVESEIDMVNAMTLATATKGGTPSARIVLLKEFNERGFVFFTHFGSRKGVELSENPGAALILFWKELERQIRIEGTVEKISTGESDRYFKTRPDESKVSAIISEQSKVVPNRKYLEKLWEGKLRKSQAEELKRPVSWGGYRVKPNRIEFWQGRPNRLNDRFLYEKEGDNWVLSRLAP